MKGKIEKKKKSVVMHVEIQTAVWLNALLGLCALLQSNSSHRNTAICWLYAKTTYISVFQVSKSYDNLGL